MHSEILAFWTNSDFRYSGRSTDFVLQNDCVKHANLHLRLISEMFHIDFEAVL